jgi:hypothetical protein
LRVGGQRQKRPSGDHGTQDKTDEAMTRRAVHSVAILADSIDQTATVGR